MKSRFLVRCLAGCIWLVFLAGCGTKLQIVKGAHFLPREMVETKVSEMNVNYASLNGSGTGEIGAIITISQYVEQDGVVVNEEDVYKTISKNIMSLLENTGKASFLASNLDDSKLENADYILYVNYFGGRPTTRLYGGSPGSPGVHNVMMKAAMVAPIFGGLAVIATLPLAAATAPRSPREKTVSADTYGFAIYDLKTGASVEAMCGSANEMIENIEEWIRIH